MVREPDATVQPSLQDDQLMAEHRIPRFKPQLRLEWRGQDGQSETEQRDHRTNLADSVTRNLRIRFSVHTAGHRSSVKISSRTPATGTLELDSCLRLNACGYGISALNRASGSVFIPMFSTISGRQ